MMSNVEFRFFKGDLKQEPLKSIFADYQKSERDRRDKIDKILAKYPFSQGVITRGGQFGRFAVGIACDVSNKEQVMAIGGCKLSHFNNELYLVKPDKRYKTGKVFAEDLKNISQIYDSHRDFSFFVLNKLNMFYFVNDWDYSPTRGTSYFSVAGVYDSTLIIKVPEPLDEKQDGAFPVVADCLTEIKESEFLALQGK
ncbi:DUF5420 family protein [Glaesserella parasuis]|nr:DUF5420 family protein [Glaesserella parasuis]KDD79557.1 hypothetical protein HPS42_09470 [Glaesserella parasuis ST4-2]MDE3995526.1 DUF5420 family protein [Glaesserella parasuis]